MTEHEFFEKYCDEKRIEVIMNEYYKAFGKRLTADKYIEMYADDDMLYDRRRVL